MNRGKGIHVPFPMGLEGTVSEALDCMLSTPVKMEGRDLPGGADAAARHCAALRQNYEQAKEDAAAAAAAAEATASSGSGRQRQKAAEAADRRAAYLYDLFGSAATELRRFEDNDVDRHVCGLVYVREDLSK
eukprot:m.464018 g.464018  ORF g.464018 m.464018 type:complete len:132 (-) comp20355_c0_seq30:114-509(-)